MTCMCGDLYCASCGPAQGNHRCEYCGSWSADGGCPDPAACKTAHEAATREEAERVAACKAAGIDPDTGAPYCPQCGSGETTYEDTIDGHAWFRCQCGHAFPNKE